MNSTKTLRTLCSLPIILLLLYFIPALGVILLIVRSFTYRRKLYSTPMILIILGIIILIPLGLDKIFSLIKFNSIPYFSSFVSSDLYSVDFIKYSKFLITLGIVFLLVGAIVTQASIKLFDKITKEVDNKKKEQREIAEKNDLIIKERKEKAQNTHGVICKSCGGENMIYGETGRCQYCRKPIKYEK